MLEAVLDMLWMAFSSVYQPSLLNPTEDGLGQLGSQFQACNSARTEVTYIAELHFAQVVDSHGGVFSRQSFNDDGASISHIQVRLHMF